MNLRSTLFAEQIFDSSSCMFLLFQLILENKNNLKAIHYMQEENHPLLKSFFPPVFSINLISSITI